MIVRAVAAGTCIAPSGSGGARAVEAPIRLQPAGRPADPPLVRAFTLVELIAVLVVLAVLSGITLPVYLDHAERARAVTTRSTLLTISTAAHAAIRDTGAIPPDVNRGTLPPMLAPYLGGDPFSTPTPYGGEYDWDGWLDEAFMAVSIRGAFRPAEDFALLDELMDDGDTGSGHLWYATSGPGGMAGGAVFYRFVP